MKIQMVDLYGQYAQIKNEIDASIGNVIENTSFINGTDVKQFSENFAQFTGAKHVITCGNGTDALQMALMALNLNRGDEVIVPGFTYAASVEAICILGLTPVVVDVDFESFNISASNIIKGISSQTKAIIPVHLFGQCCDMEAVMDIADKYGLYVIEDNAQSVASEYVSERIKRQAGTIGHIGCTSFFPAKVLGCFGDGGALMTDNSDYAERIRMIANHGQKVKYTHEIIGCNSRLDTIQAAILNVKLKYLDEYCKKRVLVANFYDNNLNNIEGILLPQRVNYSTHVFHQYTIKVENGKRDDLKKHLEKKGIPSMIYYPHSLDRQPAFRKHIRIAEPLATSNKLSDMVLSLPIHTELTVLQQNYITEAIRDYFT